MIHTPARSTTTPTLHVLVAEDGLVNRRLAHGLLTKAGYRVTLTDNGAQALSHLRSRHYDLVLMDIDMPVMNGLAATMALRRYERASGRRTPVIALTSNTNREECLAAGMDAFLPKPLDLNALQHVLSQVLGDAAA
jgi:CheY-like chemotaxis protein